MKSRISAQRSHKSKRPPTPNPSTQPTDKKKRERGVAICYPGEVKKPFNTKLTATALKRLGELAIANGISRSEVIERKIRGKLLTQELSVETSEIGELRQQLVAANAEIEQLRQAPALEPTVEDLPDLEVIRDHFLMSLNKAARKEAVKLLSQFIVEVQAPKA